MVRVSIPVDVDVDLEDIHTDDLVRELQERCSPTGGLLARITHNPSDALKLLQKSGCPREALEPVERWVRTPWVDEARLDKWTKWRRGPGPETGDEPC